MERLRRCFLCIEVLSPCGAPLAVWQRETGEAFRVIRPLLSRTDRLAERWPGARPGHPSRRVVDYGDGRAAAICDQELSPPLPLELDDRVLFRADERKLRKTLASCFDLVVSRDDIPCLPGIMRIGDWKPKPAARFPVSLAVPSTPAHLAELVVSAMAAASHPTILLTPTRSMWSERSNGVVDPQKVTLIPLEEVMEIDDGVLAASVGWGDALGVFMQNAGITLPACFSTTRKKVRVASTGGTAAKLKTAVKQWYRSARPRLLESGDLLPAPELKLIATECGVHASTAGRWLNGDYRERDKELMLLWQNIGNPEFVRSYRD